jgi:hypothetical protein
MGISRIAGAAFAAALFVGGASLAFAQEAPQGAYQQQTEQPAGHGGHGRFLTPEQRVMWHMQHRDEIKSMSEQQREVYRQQLRQQFLAMTPAQKIQMRDQLQAQWNQLPAERQQAIEQRLAQRQQHGDGQPHRQHGGAYPGGQAGQSTYPSQGPGNPDDEQN